MLATVQFDNQLTVEADEVSYAGADDFLPSKLVTSQVSVSQVSPQQTFRIGLLFAQSTGQLFHLSPHPALSLWERVQEANGTYFVTSHVKTIAGGASRRLAPSPSGRRLG
jgi:hypothetical protein